MTFALPWINTTQFSSPVYTVGASQKTVRVRLDNRTAERTAADKLQAAWERVPIPSSAVPAAGTDHTMIVWQPSKNRMWEFWQAAKGNDGRWSAKWGGYMRSVSTSVGHYTDASSWGATATSLPMLGGLVRLHELQAGRIDHALALALPQTRYRWFLWPAQRSDGKVDIADAIPKGTRLRIDPAVDLSKIPMQSTVRMMAVAAQRYGIVARDTSGSIAFYGEDPTPRTRTSGRPASSAS
jgi:hypothetical protein